MSNLAEEEKYLHLKKSRFTGKGLFTKKDIKKGQIVCTYLGERITPEEALRRCELEIDQFLVETYDDGYLDSMPIFCYAMYANDAQGLIRSEVKNNVEIQILKGEPHLVAKRNIKAGEEILVSYGRRYWNNVKKQLKEQGKLK